MYLVFQYVKINFIKEKRGICRFPVNKDSRKETIVMTDPNNKSIFQQNETSDWMLTYTFHVEDNPNVIAVKYPRYPDMYCQYGSYNTQRTAKEVHEFLKNDFPDMSFNAIVIVRAGMIQGPACYDHVSNNLFVKEELSDPDKFSKVVNEAYFPARNIHDVIMHEVGGHKRHWQSIRAFYNQNRDQFIDIDDAKNNLETDLRRYVKEMDYEDAEWINRTISENASMSFKFPKRIADRLNELIADAIVLKSQHKLKADRLWKLIQEVISYDD